jgi:hypothetical protein
MDPRQRAYLDLLTHGLPAVRNLSRSERIALCRVEADHLHNIPSLLEEANEHRHRYYLEQERALYLERLRQLGELDYLKSRMAFYGEAWRVLARAAGVPLPDC